MKHRAILPLAALLASVAAEAQTNINPPFAAVQHAGSTVAGRASCPYDAGLSGSAQEPIVFHTRCSIYDGSASLDLPFRGSITSEGYATGNPAGHFTSASFSLTGQGGTPGGSVDLSAGTAMNVLLARPVAPDPYSITVRRIDTEALLGSWTAGAFASGSAVRQSYIEFYQADPLNGYNRGDIAFSTMEETLNLATGARTLVSRLCISGGACTANDGAFTFSSEFLNSNGIFGMYEEASASIRGSFYDDYAGNGFQLSADVTTTYSLDGDVESTPEPATLALFFPGLLGIAVTLRGRSGRPRHPS